eukprot:106793-Rhodomonas_salina.1
MQQLCYNFSSLAEEMKELIANVLVTVRGKKIKIKLFLTPDMSVTWSWFRVGGGNVALFCS